MMCFLRTHRLRLACTAAAVLGLLWLSTLPNVGADGVFHDFNPQTWGHLEPGGGCCYTP